MRLAFYIEVDVDCSFNEFILNWCSQVPHWRYLTNEGISFFKGKNKRDWKKHAIL